MVDIADRVAGDSTEDVDLVLLLDRHAEAWYQQFHAPIVGVVETYDKTIQSADVRPIVLMYIEGQAVTQVPVLRSVPVAFPGGALTSYTWPLAAGDRVELVPQDADIGAYVASGSINQLPQSQRRFSLSDAIAFPLSTRSRAAPLPASAVADDGGVLAGLHYAGSSAATKTVVIDQDAVNKNSSLGTWMGQVETFINGLAPGTVTPLSTSFTAIGTAQSTATKFKAE